MLFKVDILFVFIRIVTGDDSGNLIVWNIEVKFMKIYAKKLEY